MRIAVSGTHATGKTTLVDELGERLPQYLIVPEPYVVLDEEGYTFAFPPTIEDYIAQLRQSMLTLQDPAPDLIADRCPLDFLGYISACGGQLWPDLKSLWQPIRTAVASLDLIVAVGIDPVHDPDIEHDRLRRTVDAELWDIVVNDSLELCEGVEVMPLACSWEHRAGTVLAHMAEMQGTSTCP